MDLSSLSALIPDRARSLGLEGCGMAAAAPTGFEAACLDRWIGQDCHAGMTYMARHAQLRGDITRLVPGARTVISVYCNYRPLVEQPPDIPVIAGFAFGEDYHRVLKDKLFQLKAFMEQACGPFNARIFVDSAPLFEKAWAVRCGLGWIGRHSMLITPRFGSYVFLGELVCDLPLPVPPVRTSRDAVPGAGCGTCRRCIDACPTGALSSQGLDARRCLSYLTIEHRGSIDTPLHGHLFGCDNCIKACPHNRQVPPTREPRFACRPGMTTLTAEDWLRMDASSFKACWGHTPLARAGLEKLKQHLSAPPAGSSGQ